MNNVPNQRTGRMVYPNRRSDRRTLPATTRLAIGSIGVVIAIILVVALGAGNFGG